jgi:uncharacterized protein YciI
MTAMIRSRAILSVIVLACTVVDAGAFVAAPAPIADVQTAARLFAVRFRPGAAWDAAKTPNQQTGFAAHSANLQRLRKEGSIALGGRFAEYGLIVIRAADDAAAKAMFAPDETLAAGVFVMQIDPWATIFDGCTK